MKVLVTGGSGFIAAHCLEILLAHKHTVVTTVRSKAKGDKILQAFPNASKDQLSYVIVEDISKEGAFNEAVKADPPFEAVLHTASPFHHNFDKPTELLEPALHGTEGILKAIKNSAPTVKRVVITSSFAAIVNMKNHPKTYDESVWNPVTYDEGIEDRSQTYRASKTLAEKAAWDFVKNEKPNFTISTINPPMVYGPIQPLLQPNLDSINTSNQRFVSLMQGGWKKEIPASATNIWVDVRDLALAHVLSIEVPEAAGKRFFITAGYYSNKDIADIAKREFPEYAENFPAEYSSDWDNKFAIDNSQSKDVLGLKYTPLEKTVVDVIKSLKSIGA